jgi:hypothetical protein
MFRRVAMISSGLLAVTMLTVSEPSASATEFPTGVVLTDGAGDVWVDRSGFGDNLDTRVSFPPADVKRAVVRHATYAVRIRMRFVNLRRLGDQAFQAEIETSGGGLSNADVGSSPGHRSGSHSFHSGGFPDTGCPGMTHRINYATDVVRMRIPRSCLGRPRWVRVTLFNFMITTSDDGDVFHVDNPHNHNVFGTPTRRLFRG